MGQKRELHRITVDRRGTLRRGGETATCEILDLTENGVQLKTDLPVTAGDALQLAVGLTDSVAIRCGIRVTRVNGTSVGTCITDITPADEEQLSRFIESLIALNLGGL